MLKSLGLDMPAKAKEQNGQDAVGEFDIEKFYTFQFFTPKKIHSKAWVIKLAFPFSERNQADAKLARIPVPPTAFQYFTRAALRKSPRVSK